MMWIIGLVVFVVMFTRGLARNEQRRREQALLSTIRALEERIEAMEDDDDDDYDYDDEEVA